MSWAYLLIASLFEVGWPVGLKLSQNPEWRVAGIAMALACMTISSVFLWFAQREIPIGTAYAVLTGIGAAGTFAVGLAFFADPASLSRFFGVGLIVAGVAVLKLV